LAVIFPRQKPLLPQVPTKDLRVPSLSFDEKTRHDVVGC